VFALQQPSSAAVQLHLDRFRRDEAAASHDQLSARGFVGIHMKCDLPLDHGLLAAADLCHIGPDRAGDRSKPIGGLCEMCDPGAPDFILAGHARDSRT
jgi:hypothetical protein